MTKESILKKFSFIKPANYGPCISCAYVDSCDKILPCFINPRKCGGPFSKNINAKQ